MFSIADIQTFIVVFVLSSIASFVIYKTRNAQSASSLDQLEGVQKFHSAPTPRIGGVALVLGMLGGWALIHGESSQLLGLLFAAGLPVFLYGLAEDLLKNVSVRARLLASVLAGLMFCLLTGYAIERIFVWWFDILLGVTAISIGLTVFAISSATNAINIIDGFHGLASGAILLMLAAVGFVSWQVGDAALLRITAIIFVATLGFFVVNFPFGKLFLGDGGAYFLGFLLAALTVMLPARNAEVSPWISPLILAYPLTELVVSMTRKARRAGHQVSQPDNLHLHMLLYRRVVKSFGNSPEYVTHGMTSAILWIMPATSLLLVMLSQFQAQFAYLGTLTIFVFYLVLYNVLMRTDRG